MTEQEIKKRFPISFFLKIITVIIVLIAINMKVESKEEWWYQLLRGLSYFLVPSIFISIVRFVVIALYNARHAKRAVRGNFVLGINRLTAMINSILIVIAIMVTFGINPKEFVTSLTIVAMAIAVIFRDYITNLISGLFIMFSEQLSVGDRIKMGDQKGRIVDITFANIELQNDEDDIVMIPNNLVFSSPMVNLSAHRSNLFTVKFELPLQVAADIDALEEEMKAMLVNHPNIEADSDIVLTVVEIGKDFVRYKIELHAVSSSNRLHKQIENEILKQILVYQKANTKSV